MLRALGCPVSEQLLTQWKHQLVCEAAPFFLTNDLILPDETLILSREAFAAINFELSYRDSYTTYAVKPEAKRVAFLSPPEFDVLPPELQQALLAAQRELRRGQVYIWDDVSIFLQSCLEQVTSRCISVSDQTYLVLDHKIWWLLDDDTRNRWLLKFIAVDNPPPVCLLPCLMMNGPG